MDRVILKTENLSVGYDGKCLIDSLSVDIAPGRLTALFGRNGSGKSTLLRALSGEGKPLSGRVLLDGCDIFRMKPGARAAKVAFVRTERVRVPDMKCFDLVALGRSPYTDWIGRLSARDEEIVRNALETVGMADYAGRTMDKMSDGECQRIMIARALAQDTPVILLDEPTSFLDYPGRRETVALLKSLASEKGKAVVFSTHDIEVAMEHIDGAIVLDPPRGFVSTVGELIDGQVLNGLFGYSSLR